jgi:hypothetical protein
MNGSEFIVHAVDDGMLEGLHHAVLKDRGLDVDEITCHVILCVLTNDCACLIECLQRSQPLGISIAALHHLHGKYKGCIEVDLQLMQRSARKTWRASTAHQLEL